MLRERLDAALTGLDADTAVGLTAAYLQASYDRAPLVETLTVKLWTTLGGKVMIFPNAAVVTFIVLVPTVIIFFLAERAMRNDGALAAGMGKL